MKYCVVTSCTSWHEWEASIVSRHPTKELAQAVCKPSQWVEELPEDVEYKSSITEEWR